MNTKIIMPRLTPVLFALLLCLSAPAFADGAPGSSGAPGGGAPGTSTAPGGSTAPGTSTAPGGSTAPGTSTAPGGPAPNVGSVYH